MAAWQGVYAAPNQRRALFKIVLIGILMVTSHEVEAKKKKKVKDVGTISRPHKDFCKTASDDCASYGDIKGLEDSFSSLTLGGGGQGDSKAEKDRKLAQVLRDVEDKHLKAPLTPSQRAKPVGIAHHRKVHQAHSSGFSVRYILHGSNYAFTTVPGSSDYDIQFCIEVPKTKQNHVKTSSATADGCGDPAWRKIKGGPDGLLDSNGFLSTSKARLAIQSAIDRALSKQAVPAFQGQSVHVTRSVSGPATTLEARWNGESVSIDIVVCLKADDVEKSGGHDFVGKPYKGSVGSPTAEFWRLSYSRKELAKLREFHRNTPSESDWDRANLVKRFKDMVRLIMESLESQKMMLYFNKEVNLLSTYNAGALREATNYLRRMSNRNNYIDLLEGLL